MSRAVALKLQPQAALAVVVRSGGRAIAVEAVVRVSLADGDSPQAIGEKLAAALKPHGAERAPTVVAVPRVDLHWQNYELPPAPEADLPDLVLLQAQRDIVLADDGVGFDFLSLDGNADHPHRVLTFGVTPSQLERLRGVCTAADLKLQRIVPEAFGWLELGRRLADESGGDATPLTVFAAISGRQAAVWATQDGTLRLLRTVVLAAEPDAAADAATLAGELRRTLLSLSQMAGAPSASLPCYFCGENADATARPLSQALARPVRAARLDAAVELPDSPADTLTHVAPLAALAAATAESRPAPVDLLHPHRPPAPPSRRRTYALAGAAAASVVALLAWTAYSNLQAPLAAAAEADAARAKLAPTLERLAKDEQQAAAIDAWLSSSVNLLTELDHLGRRLRPQPLDAADFKADEDVVITKLVVSGRLLTIDAAAKTTEAVQPIELRLREGGYRVDRRAVEAKGDATPGYAATVSGVIERIEPLPVDGDDDDQADVAKSDANTTDANKPGAVAEAAP